MDKLKVTLLQTDIIWEDVKANLSHIEIIFKNLKDQTNLVVLPEMFTTGFTGSNNELAESMYGDTIQFLQKISTDYNFAIAGSLIISENKSFYNRFVFITPEQNIYSYDKKHLFRLGDEYKSFTPGSERVIISYLGWNICPLICYDLRFPIWCRNQNLEYDLMLFTANWPSSRIEVWDLLLRARAIENLSYVCGVNRVGRDGNQLDYIGRSALIDFKGNIISNIPDHREYFQTITLSKSDLTQFRQKFPVWRDSDQFSLI